MNRFIGSLSFAIAAGCFGFAYGMSSIALLIVGIPFLLIGSACYMTMKSNTPEPDYENMGDTYSPSARPGSTPPRRSNPTRHRHSSGGGRIGVDEDIVDDMVEDAIITAAILAAPEREVYYAPSEPTPSYDSGSSYDSYDSGDSGGGDD